MMQSKVAGVEKDYTLRIEKDGKEVMSINVERTTELCAVLTVLNGILHTGCTVEDIAAIRDTVQRAVGS